jgi:hypothetical protein|tara:strand:- start:6472 stop:7065 length:594 start_codon:yes stop_codon:yes gene_type:complete
MAITDGLATLAQVKTNLDLTDSVDDTMLELCIESASRQIEQFTERIFTQVSATRIYTPRDSYVVETDDIYSITHLKTSTAADGVFDETWAASDRQTEPLNGIAGGIASPITSIRAVGDYLFPISGGEATVQIAGTFGWAAIPTAITQACILQSSRYYKRADSPMGVAGFDAMGVVRLSRIDPDIATLIEPFCKIRMA